MKHARCEKPARARSWPAEQSRVVSKSPWSAGKRKANRIGEDGTAVGTAEKSGSHTVTAMRRAAGNRLVDGLAGNVMRVVGVKWVRRVASGANACTRESTLRA
jgi:hypothetical protein